VKVQAGSIATTSPAGAGTTTAGAVSIGYRAGKRALDLVVASVCLLLASPILIATWVIVRATSPGQALFRQRRVGRNGRTFVLYKFRTMHNGCADDIHRDYVCKLLSEDQPPTGGQSGVYKLQADPRITRIGRFLRKSSIDELPQLFNVIRGDMSLVGPRPALPWEAELFGLAYARRFLVAPGLTGLWQVSGRNCLTMRQGLELDIEYVERRSLALDLKILLKTIPAVVSGAGAL
jgi:lipopolysaccharide/colanic/teichoic acid biosynthesis glycosyltransferase